MPNWTLTALAFVVLIQQVVVVAISFTLASPLRGYAGYHNYSYPNLTTVNVQITCRRILCLVRACVIQTDFVVGVNPWVLHTDETVFPDGSRQKVTQSSCNE